METTHNTTPVQRQTACPNCGLPVNQLRHEHTRCPRCGEALGQPQQTPGARCEQASFSSDLGQKEDPTSGIRHTAKDIREALRSKSEPNVYIRWPESSWPVRVVDVRKYDDDLEVRVLDGGRVRWVTVQDADVIYSMR